MSPKTATISFALLSLTFTTVTLYSAAAQKGCPGNTVPEVLEHYELPPGLIPDYVKDFKCDPVSNSDAVSLSIQLQGVCKVTREMWFVRNVVECKPEITAIVSRQQLTNIKGVTVRLTFVLFPILKLRVAVSEAKVFETSRGKVLQFYSAGSAFQSPEFNVNSLPAQPPSCDRSGAVAFDYSDDNPAGAVVVAKNDQDVPSWVYKYGRLLPVVAA